MTTILYHYLEVTDADLLLEILDGLLLEDGGDLLLEAYYLGVEFMTTTMFDLTYRVARELGVVLEGTATGGSTTTLIDTSKASKDDDYWNEGSLWVLRDDAGGGAAPEGEWGYISDHDNGSSTTTIATALTIAIANGDRYAVADDEYPLDTIISQINRSLTDMGVITYTDTTTITTADNQTEYTLPTGLSGGALEEVWIQNVDDDADDNRWTIIKNWRVQITSIGTADELILQYQYASGYAIMLVFVAPHPEMYVRTSKLSESIPLANILYPSVLNLLRLKKASTENPKYDTEIVKYEIKVANLLPLPEPSEGARLLTLEAVGTRRSEPDKVYLW